MLVVADLLWQVAFDSVAYPCEYWPDRSVIVLLRRLLMILSLLFLRKSFSVDMYRVRERIWI